MHHLITRFYLLIVLVLPVLIMGPITPINASQSTQVGPVSTLSDIRLYPLIANGKTDIAVAVCADVLNFQFRSEQTGVFLSQIFVRATRCPVNVAGSWRAVVGAVPGQCFTIYAFATEATLSEADFMARAARYTVCVTALGALSTPQRQSITAPAASIDAPAPGATVQGTITLSGWAIDAASWSGPGVDQVQIYNGATLLGTASYGQARTDVASAYGDSRYTNSGYTYQLDTTRLTNGTYTLKISYHSTINGGWNDMTRTVQVNNPPNPAIHQDTQLRGAVENGTTTIWLKVCGTGQQYRFRSFEIDTGKVLWDGTYGTINGCSPEYRAVIGAVTNETFRFYSTVMNTSLSDAEFLERRRDACRVYSPGVIRCLTGDTPPPPPIATPVPQPPPPPLHTGDWPVPYYNQGDPTWGNNKIGACTKTIQDVGCALTSLAMIFKFYGVDQNPGTLNNCLGSDACLMNWRSSKIASCSGGKVSWSAWPTFNTQAELYARLEQELKTRPVILEISNNKGNGHFIVVLGGSGSNPSNYRVNDPGVRGGARNNLKNTLDFWYKHHDFRFEPKSMRLYSGTPAFTAADIPLATTSPSPLAAPQPSAGESVSGVAVIYTNTDTGVILELAAQSSASAITDMRIWTDQHPSDIWQPFSPYVKVPLDTAIYVQFRDAAGNLSATIEAGTPVAPLQDIQQNIQQVFLPLMIR